MSFDEPSVSRVRQLLGAIVGRRIAVIGDAMLDDYVFGEVRRISPEAPVPVLAVEREQFMLGGAANVAKCLIALGAAVRLCCITGRDADGELFLTEAANLGVDVRGVVFDPKRATTRKTRIIARQQQVIRLDRESLEPLHDAIARKLVSRVRQAVRWADAVILSDYAKGVLGDAVCRAAIDGAGDKPVLVDPKDLPWDRYRGATLIKPNRREAEAFTGTRIIDEASAAAAARTISRRLNGHTLITRGRDGMTLALQRAKGKAVAHTLTARLRQLVDVTGAGDVVAATLSSALAGGATLPEATWLANAAAAVKVGKFGAATVTGQEILETMGSGAVDYERKVMSRDAVAQLAADCRKRHKKVVFTNGCFDILHVGHVSYLERSRRLGDALIVGINTDASVRRLKGEGRPVQSQEDRAHIIASLACVDAVVLFDEDTPLELIKAVRPDVLAKGADYKSKRNVVGWEMVEKAGGRVVLVELVEGRSTTGVLGRTRL